jgi:hypothetical protein
MNVHDVKPSTCLEQEPRRVDSALLRRQMQRREPNLILQIEIGATCNQLGDSSASLGYADACSGERPSRPITSTPPAGSPHRIRIDEVAIRSPRHRVLV